MIDRFLVLGATGLVGSRVLHQLRSRGLDALGATRRPGAGHHVRLDLASPSTHAAALKGRTTVLLVSRPGDEAAGAVARPFIEAMKQAGVRRVVVLSALGVRSWPGGALGEVESRVEASGLAWTHVRPNFYMQSFVRPPLAYEIASTGALRLPFGEAPIAYVDARDVADVACRAMTDEAMAGRALDVSGPDAWPHARLLECLSMACGCHVRHVDLTLEEAGAKLRERGSTTAQVERVLRFYALVRAGAFAAVDSGAAALLGRPLRTWQGFVEEHRGTWQHLGGAFGWRAALPPHPGQTRTAAG